MKKIFTFALCALAVGALASCGNDSKKIVVKNLKGGTDEEREIISTVVNGAIITNGSGTTILPTSNLELQEDNGDYVLLSTSQRKQGYTVKMTWAAETTGCSYELIDIDANHKYCDIGYPGYKKGDGSITFKLTSISCGGAASENPEISYPCVVKCGTLVRDVKKISELNSVSKKNVDLVDKQGKVVAHVDDGYDLVDYTIKDKTGKSSPYFATNNKGVESHEYFYVTTPGKMIYKAPDGNWGLLADGDEIMEVYAGSAYNVNSKTYPALMDNDYVAVDGNMSQYNGNIQIGFMTRMKKIDKSTITEPTLSYQEITSQKVQALKDSLGGHKQCIAGVNLSNALWELEGTYVKDSCSLEDPQVGSRFTFKMALNGGEEVTIAYDYHVCKADNAPKDVFNNLKALVKNGGAAHIKGTLRYCGNHSQPFYQTEGSTGEWQLIPFFDNDVVLADK